MNRAELMTALNTVEQDHRLVLDNVETLKETVSSLLEPDWADSQQILAKLQEINAYFATQFEAHLDEEETTLFPLLEQQKPEGPELVARLRLEHEQIRSKRKDFGNCLELAVELEEGLTKMVLRDLLIYGLDLWEMLDKHAHVETQAVHQCVARYLQHTLDSSTRGSG
jgi:hemerythrin-like domain-containing protein